jgi:cell division initiation protein
MKITPLELRQFEFEKTFRGYSIEEVDMFINNLAQEWERVLTETKMMRMQLELAEKEASKLREIELTLFKTLKTAEDTSTMITEQANQQAARNLSEASMKANKQVADAHMEADKYLVEAKIEAEKILSDARLKANDTMQQADDKAKYVKEDVLSEVKAIENDFNTLVNYKEQLLTQMRGFATATFEHVERFEGKFDIKAIESKIKKANGLVAVTSLPKEVVEGENYTEVNSINQSSENESPIEENNTEVEEENTVELTAINFIENIDEETIDDVSIEDTSDDEIVIQNGVAELDAEVLENYGDDKVEKVVESYGEVETKTEYVEEEDRKPDLNIVNSIKEKIAGTSSVEQNRTEEIVEERTSVTPPSVNQLVTEEVEYTAATGDDLTRIEGIGIKVQDILKGVGILTFRDIATTPLYKIKEHLQSAGPHYNMLGASTWTEQALLAAEGRWDELEVRQEELIGGRETEPRTEQKPKLVEEVVAKTSVETKSVVLESREVVETETEVPTRKVLESNLENITEEMLEKVNKVKSAIRKAMSEKNEKSDAEKKKKNLSTLDDVLRRNRDKGSGSFFDNID